MKIRRFFIRLAGLAPALLFVSASAVAASPFDVQSPWVPAAGLAAGTTPTASHAAVFKIAWPEQEITASDGTTHDIYGYSAALESNTAFVAAPHATIGGNVNEGAVYVYEKQNGVWTQVQKIVPDDGGAYDEFGISISASGNTLLVGSVQHGGTGAAYVFTLTDGHWSQSQEFTASDTFGFGYEVSLDQGTAIIGAPGQDNFSGAAYVFTRTNGAWSQTAELTPNDGGPGWFGESVGISGNTIVVGADPQPGLGGDSVEGAAYVFTQSGNGWNQTQKLTASDGGIGDFFGFHVAVSGATMFVSAPFRQVGAFNFGVVYVFIESGGHWNQTQKLIGSDDTGPNQFGNRVALKGDTAVVGVPVASFSGFLSFEGAAYVYTKVGSTWSQEEVLTADDPSPGEFFGWAVGLSGNGILAASYGGDGPDSAYVFGPINLGTSASTP